MTTKAQLEAMVGRKLRDDMAVVDDEVVRVDTDGTIVERFGAGTGDGVYVPAAPESLVSSTRTNRPGMSSSFERITKPPTEADRFATQHDPDAIPFDHPDRVAHNPIRFAASDQKFGARKVKVVDGIACEFVDERGPSSKDKDGGIRVV